MGVLLKSRLMKRIFYLLASLLPGTMFAQATHVVISEVYGGGGNSGATYTHDFIELYNPTSSPVSLNGWSVQYASATGSFTQRTVLSGSIAANGYFLIQQAAGSGGTTALPTPDVIGTIAMSGTNFKVALVNDSTTIGTSCVATSIVDLVGVGATASCSETSPAGIISNSTSAERKASATSTATTLGNGGSEQYSGNGYDSDNNSTDFVVQSNVNPQNSSDLEGPAVAATIFVSTASSAAEPSTNGMFVVQVGAPAPAGGISLSYSLSGTATVGSDYSDPKAGSVFIAAGKLRDTVRINIIDDLVSEGSETVIITLGTPPTGFTLGTGTATMTIADNEVFITKISAIQGTGNTAIAGSYSAEAIVTGVYPNLSPAGFYMQEESSDTDANIASSEGIFVVSGTAVTIGDKVLVTGNVVESSASPSFNQAVFTTGSTVSIISNGNTIPPASVLKLPVTALSDFERYEGMLVRVDDTLTVTNNYGLDRYGELGLSAGGMVYQPTEILDLNDNPSSGTSSSGTGNIAAIQALSTANQLRTITLDDGRNTTTSLPYVNPVDSTLRLGSTVTGLRGILGYAFSAYRIQPVPSSAPVFSYAARPGLPGLDSNNLKVASFNVLNYFNGDGNGGGFPTARGAHSMAEFTRQRVKIIAAISQLNADIVGLIEIENDGTGASSAIQDLVNGLNTAMGAGTYAIVNDGATTQQFSGDAIRCGIIYKPSKVSLSGAAMLDASAVHNRPPLAQAFMHIQTGKKIVYVVNHFKSKGCGSASGADQDQGDGQSCYNDTRRYQAQALIDWIDTAVIPASGTGMVLSMGDYNAYREEDPMDLLRASGYQVLGYPGSYSYQFSGQIGSLDHAVVSDSLNSFVTGIAKWNINAAEPVYLDYNDAINDGSGDFANPFASTWKPDVFRSSDHDPVLVGILFPEPVGIKNTTLKGDAMVVPNPASGNAVLRTSKLLSGVNIYSIDGRRIHTQIVNGSRSVDIDLQAAPAGLYSVEAIYIDGSREQIRLTRGNW